MAKKKCIYEDDVLSKSIAEKILEKYKDKFQTLDLTRIKFVRLVSDKATKFASVTSVRFPASLYTKDKYVVTTYAARFDALDENKQNLVIYHELLHISPRFNGALCKHDTEDFASIIKEFGPHWTNEGEIRNILKD